VDLDAGARFGNAPHNQTTAGAAERVTVLGELRERPRALARVNHKRGDLMKPANNGPFYAAGLYTKLAEVFRSHGYALAVHGSVACDFDLIAVPWVDEAADPDDVVTALLARFALKRTDLDREPTPKPHGRIAYSVHLSFGDCCLDISFTPRTGEWGVAKVAP
jgi:hypothetical protein